MIVESIQRVYSLEWNQSYNYCNYESHQLSSHIHHTYRGNIIVKSIQSVYTHKEQKLV